jgi:hypothetical protein
MYNRGKIMSDEERYTIEAWAQNLIKNHGDKKRREHNKNGIGMYHFVLFKDDPIVLPLVWDIRNRIIQKEGLEKFTESCDSMRDVLMVIEKGYVLPRHIDYNKGIYIRSRFNVFITVPKKGGETYYDENLIDAKEGCYVLCRSGIDPHYSTPNEDEISRISLSFGFLLTTQKLDELTSDKSIGTYKYYPLSLNT